MLAVSIAIAATLRFFNKKSTASAENPGKRRPATSPGLWGLPGPVAPQAYLHAVATADGLRLDEHLSELTERPPMGHVLTEVSAYPAGM